MIGADFVVAVGDDEEDAKLADAPAEEAKQLQRGAVGPMGVFADEDGRSRSRGEGAPAPPERAAPGIAIKGMLVDVEAERGGQVAHRTERTGRGERVARGAQHCRRVGDAWQNASTSVVLPTPASPPTSTTRPCPAAAWRRCSASCSRCGSRSSSSIAVCSSVRGS